MLNNKFYKLVILAALKLDTIINVIKVVEKNKYYAYKEVIDITANSKGET